MSSEISKLLGSFAKQRIMVVGDFMLDEYLEGRVERISPEAPVPVVLQQESRYLPGGAGNVVCNLRSLGASVELLGCLGKDEAAGVLKKSFQNLGVKMAEMAFLESDDRPTTRKTRILAGAHQMLRLDREDTRPLTAKQNELVLQDFEKRLPECSAIIISDYDKGLIGPQLIAKMIDLATKQKCFIAVDPQVTHFSYYKKVDILTPNHHEAGRFLGRKLEDQNQIESAGFEIMQKLKAKNLLITRGESGMSLFKASTRKVHHIPTVAREVFDVTGAGDTVIAVFALAVGAGASLLQAAELSNRAAGLVVAHLGAATVNTDELQDVMYFNEK